MKFIYLNTLTFPCIGTHLFHVRKLAQGFQQLGYLAVEVARDEDLDVLGLASEDLVYLSNHGASHQLSKMQTLLLTRIAECGAWPIFWYWHDYAAKLDLIFGSRWILTGEKFRSRTLAPSHQSANRVASARRNFVATPFASGVEAITSGMLDGQRPYDVGYVGAPYKMAINAALKIELGKRFRLRLTPPMSFLNESERLPFFLESTASFCWHSPSNIQNGVVTERVFEAMALGSVVVTDNPYALEATGGHAIFANNLPSALDSLTYIASNRSQIDELRESALDWVLKHGTYTEVAKRFVEFSKERHI